MTVLRRSEFVLQRSEAKLREDEVGSSGTAETGVQFAGLPDGSPLKKRIGQGMLKEARKKGKWLRFSQLSQGVLGAIQKILCRATLSGVLSLFFFLLCTCNGANIVHPCRNHVW